MKTTGTMLLLAIASLMACGGAKPPRQAGAPVSMNESLPDEEQPMTGGMPAPVGTGETIEPTVAPPVPPVPPPPIAVADLIAVKGGAALGTITFEHGADGKLVIAGSFTGLKAKSVHAFYVHQGDCSNGGKRVGGHLDPTQAKHGGVAAAVRHAGDLGNLIADADGNATFSHLTDRLTIEAGRPDSVLSRAIVIHAGKDDKKGSGGAVLACGVISLRQ